MAKVRETLVAPEPVAPEQAGLALEMLESPALAQAGLALVAPEQVARELVAPERVALEQAGVALVALGQVARERAVLEPAVLITALRVLLTIVINTRVVGFTISSANRNQI
jgi:hypothetical protein